MRGGAPIMAVLRRFVLALALCTIASPVWADYQTGVDAYQRGDYATALREWRPLAERGDSRAQFNLGFMYANGHGTSQNYAEAVKWYRKAANQGQAVATYNLGIMYHNGRGVSEDFAEAVKWYRKAADQGYDSALLDLGIMYHEGRDAPQDFAAAALWYRKAADQWDDIAQRYVKTMLLSTAATAAESPNRFITMSAKTVCMISLTPISQPIDWDRSGLYTGYIREAKSRGLTLQQCAELSGREARVPDSQTGFRKFQRELSELNRPEAREVSSAEPATLPRRIDGTQDVTPPSRFVMVVQTRLAKLGYTPGPSDGVMGRKTRAAIESFQRDESLSATGEPTQMLAKLLESKLASRQEPPRPDPTIQTADLGTFHALVIGNDAYRSLPQLRTAVKDAHAVAELLEGRYGFRAKTLINATRDDVIKALDALRSKLTERDNLLIYYAGHGKLDRGSDRGFWLPVDAKEDSRANWLNNVTITDTLKAIRAKHVMVVADSCYSGTLTRDTRGIEVRPKESDYISKTHGKKSRTVLASGGLEPVSDSGGSGHSVFAKAFMDALRDNQGVIDGLDVFAYVRKQVRLNADQVPNYANIRYAGHEVGGDFLFARKLERRSEASMAKPTVAAIQPTPVPQPSSPVQPAVGIYPKTYKTGDIFKDCTDCPEMVVIPSGSFHMGDLSGEGLKEERPVRTVNIRYRFAVGKYEVTQAEWQAVMGWNPSKFKGERNPVERVSWNEAKEFVRELSAKTGKTYRLLSEAEWEYMARAGSTTKYPWGNSFASSQAKGGGGHGVPVGSYRPNAFGVYDTVGNVHEWTEDCWHNSYEGATADGRAWTTGGNCSRRVLRGVSGNGRGSWNADRDERYFDFTGFDLVDDTGDTVPAGVVAVTVLRPGDSANRDAGGAVSRHGYIGFRVARTL
jgi:formylglycine-generating enzyme required for sulfatase activity/peptidoglycan hydrolase-like protein with peptidoglycan-binding domain